jgi:fructokinase
MPAPRSRENVLDRLTSHARVLVVGEALIDVIRVGNRSREHPGGSPANVALGLGRLGVATSFLTALGRDARGSLIAERLEEANVTLLPESWSLPHTSSATATIAADGSATYDFGITWQLPEHIDIPPVRHVHVGSISAFLKPGSDTVEQLVEVLRPEATVSFDPNIRADLVGDHADAVARFERLAQLADIVKLSDEDASFLYPHLNAEEAARAIASAGALVAVTKGAAGSILASEDAEIVVEPIPVQVVDTVGAGDSYMAALLSRLLDADAHSIRDHSQVDLAAAGEFAARAAAITVSRAGAEPPRSAELSGRRSADHEPSGEDHV